MFSCTREVPEQNTLKVREMNRVAKHSCIRGGSIPREGDSFSSFSHGLQTLAVLCFWNCGTITGQRVHIPEISGKGLHPAARRTRRHHS